MLIETSPAEISMANRAEQRHCDGPASTTSGSDTTGALPPSPTESVGCEPHGDHWHCDGPRPTGGDDDHSDEHEDEHEEHDDHDDTSTGGVLPPSPTESVGCEPHGDHWHCDGPAAASTTLPGTSSGVLPPSPTASVGCEPHGDHWHCDGPRTNDTESDADGQTDDSEGPPSDDASAISGISGFVVGLAVLVGAALGL